MKRLGLFLLLTMAMFADALSDAKLTDTIRLRLAGDREVKGAALEADVTDGVVVLRGKVTSEKQRDRATKVVKRIKGVKSVTNKIEVAPV